MQPVMQSTMQLNPVMIALYNVSIELFVTQRISC